MQSSNLRTQPRTALAVVSESSPGPGTRKGIFFLILAFGVFPLGVFLDRFFAPASAAHWILPIACFVVYLILSRKAILAWRPDADRLWRNKEGKLR